MLGLSWLPAQAASYIFPDNLPSGCGADGNGSYTCSALALAAGDTLTNKLPTTITVNGAFTSGAASVINPGAASSLSLIVNGTTSLGDATILNANLNGTGVINIGTNNIIAGALKTDSAAINVGAGSSVTGAIASSIAGVITVGADSTVVGNLSTASGAINLGARSTVKGTISTTLAGAITLGANAKVTGNVASTYLGSDTGAGAITLEANAEVDGGVTTNTGAITVGAAGKVGLNIITNNGAITVGANSAVGGSVCTGTAGAITVGASATVGGNVETASAGAITIGTLDKVSGDVKVWNAGATTVAPDATVGLTRIGTGCGIVLDSDGDGVSDANDEFPNDAGKAYSLWYPGSSSYGTLAYEDNWPSRGDYDMNDIVVRYRSRQILNARRQVKALEMDLVLAARGGAYQSGFAVALPGIAPGQVQSVSLTQDGVTLTRPVLLANVTGEDGAAVFEIFPDAIPLMPDDNSSSCAAAGKGFRNTGQNCPIQPSVSFKLTLEFTLALDKFPLAPYDPFIFNTSSSVYKIKGSEIHLKGKQATSRADLTLFNTQDDNSGARGSDGKYAHSYTSNTGLPWAVDVPALWDYPSDKTEVLSAYPKMLDWVNSGGKSNADWYLTPVTGKTFRNGR